MRILAYMSHFSSVRLACALILSATFTLQTCLISCPLYVDPGFATGVLRMTAAIGRNIERNVVAQQTYTRGSACRPSGNSPGPLFCNMIRGVLEGDVAGDLGNQNLLVFFYFGHIFFHRAFLASWGSARPPFPKHSEPWNELRYGMFIVRFFCEKASTSKFGTPR